MAEALVSGAFLSAALQAFSERMASVHILNFVRRKKLNEGLLNELKIMLPSANSVMNDAEEKQHTDSNVRNWLEELKDVIYEAEDLVYEINTEAMRSEIKDQSAGSSAVFQVLNFFSSRVTVENLEAKVLEILRTLELIVNRKDYLGLKEGLGITPLQLSSSATPSLVDRDIYGRDADKEAIIQLLLSDDKKGDNKISVIPIVGMSGIGKTTLTHLVYRDIDDRVINKPFDFKAWISVSHEFDAFTLAKTIYEKVTESEDCPITETSQLLLKLNECLKDKKFLIVLDDVWSKNLEYWHAIKSPFDSAAHGSKIIVTTISTKVASTMGTVPHYYLRTISEEDSWRLFAKQAFDEEEPSAYPDLEAIGRRIVKKCQGLPLAIISLGGRLRSKLNPEEWKNILENNLWGLVKGGSDILQRLWLSYYYLPPHLKRCFTYCSIFSKNYNVEKEKLILLWMADDLLLPHEHKVPEEVGKEYFDNLKSSFYFEETKVWDDSVYFSMHDLMYALATSIEEDRFLRLDDTHTGKAPTKKLRHLLCIERSKHDLNKYMDSSRAKKLRTLIVSSQFQLNHLVLEKLLPKLTCLRVLSLCKCSTIKLPRSIGKLKNLRYLDVSGTEIEELPDEVCTLYNLQTLLLSGCRRLTMLPTNIGSLFNLCHLDITYTHLREMPLQMGSLKGLRTLKGFDLGRHGWSSIKLLRDLRYLHGKLHISGLENVVDVEDVLVGNLMDKQNLSELQFSWSCCSDDRQKHKEVLNGLQPHTNIKVLRIENFGGEGFPNWVGDNLFVNMEVIHLKGCENCTLLPPLGQLPSLKELYIEGFHGVVTIDDEFYTIGSSSTTPFRSLEILHFCKLFQWKKWSFIEGAFPCLESLYLGDCPKLDVSISLHLPSLQNMKIFNCPEVKSISEMRSPSKLNSLYISECKKLFSHRMEWSLQKFTFLRHLYIDSIDGHGLDSFPEEGLLPTTLVSLEIYNVPCRSLNGKSLQHLPSLKKLGIFGCSELQCLPEEGLPTSLSLLFIRGCPFLYQRWKREEGEGWPKLSHIPSVRIDR